MGATRDVVDDSRIQIDDTRELVRWADVPGTLSKAKVKVHVYGYVNNHFAGQSPRTASRIVSLDIEWHAYAVVESTVRRCRALLPRASCRADRDADIHDGRRALRGPHAPHARAPVLARPGTAAYLHLRHLRLRFSARAPGAAAWR